MALSFLTRVAGISYAETISIPQCTVCIHETLPLPLFPLLSKSYLAMKT